MRGQRWRYRQAQLHLQTEDDIGRCSLVHMLDLRVSMCWFNQTQTHNHVKTQEQQFLRPLCGQIVVFAKRCDQWFRDWWERFACKSFGWHMNGTLVISLAPQNVRRRQALTHFRSWQMRVVRSTRQGQIYEVCLQNIEKRHKATWRPFTLLAHKSIKHRKVSFHISIVCAKNTLLMGVWNSCEQVVLICGRIHWLQDSKHFPESRTKTLIRKDTRLQDAICFCVHFPSSVLPTGQLSETSVQEKQGQVFLRATTFVVCKTAVYATDLSEL